MNLKQFEARLARLEPSQSPGAQINLMYDVLDAIASGLLTDPVGAATRTVETLSRDGLFAPGGRFHRDGSIKAGWAPMGHASEESSAGGRNEFAGVFSRAEEMAKTFSIDPKVLDFLYAHRRDIAMPRDAWENEIRIAFCVEQLMPKLPRHILYPLVDSDAITAATEVLRSSRGMLLLVFHGGFLHGARRIFPLIYPDGMGEGLMVAGGGRLRSKNGVLKAEAEPRKALFMALKALQDGEIMFIGPDGPTGRQTGDLTVLGTHSPAGEGAAFLAYSSKCATGWYAVRRSGDGFVPVVELGPTPLEKEPFEAFQDRLYAFYAAKIEEVLTGDPRNIVLRPRWAQVFAAAQRAKA